MKKLILTALLALGTTIAYQGTAISQDSYSTDFTDEDNCGRILCNSVVYKSYYVHDYNIIPDSIPSGTLKFGGVGQSRFAHTTMEITYDPDGNAISAHSGSSGNGLGYVVMEVDADSGVLSRFAGYNSENDRELFDISNSASIDWSTGYITDLGDRHSQVGGGIRGSSSNPTSLFGVVYTNKDGVEAGGTGLYRIEQYYWGSFVAKRNDTAAFVSNYENPRNLPFGTHFYAGNLDIDDSVRGKSYAFVDFNEEKITRLYGTTGERANFKFQGNHTIYGHDIGINMQTGTFSSNDLFVGSTQSGNSFDNTISGSFAQSGSTLSAQIHKAGSDESFGSIYMGRGGLN